MQMFNDTYVGVFPLCDGWTTNLIQSQLHIVGPNLVRIERKVN